MTSNAAKLTIALLHIKGIGYQWIRRNYLMILREGQSMGYGRETLTEIARKTRIKDANDELVRLCMEFVDKQVELAEKNNARIYTLVDPEYPENLMMSRWAPPVLHVKGDQSAFNTRAVAVVGSRKHTPHGGVMAGQITAHLVEQGYVIVSGLAMGIDTIAHQETLKRGGRTVAVLAHGLEQTLPLCNAGLAEEILEKGGVLVSQFPFECEVHDYNFHTRDTVQAGLSNAVFMIQSRLKGGSLNAPKAAMFDGRLVVVPLQTPADLENNPDQVAANVVLCGNNVNEKRALLQYQGKPDVDLKNLLIIKNREDYQWLDAELEKRMPG